MFHNPNNHWLQQMCQISQIFLLLTRWNPTRKIIFGQALDGFESLKDNMSICDIFHKVEKTLFLEEFLKVNPVGYTIP